MVFKMLMQESITHFISYSNKSNIKNAQKKNAKEQVNSFTSEIRKLHNNDPRQESSEREKNNLYTNLEKIKTEDIKKIKTFIAKFKNGDFGALTKDETHNINIMELFFSSYHESRQEKTFIMRDIEKYNEDEVINTATSSTSKPTSNVSNLLNALTDSLKPANTSISKDINPISDKDEALKEKSGITDIREPATTTVLDALTSLLSKTFLPTTDLQKNKSDESFTKEASTLEAILATNVEIKRDNSKSSGAKLTEVKITNTSPNIIENRSKSFVSTGSMLGSSNYNRLKSISAKIDLPTQPMIRNTKPAVARDAFASMDSMLASLGEIKVLAKKVPIQTTSNPTKTAPIRATSNPTETFPKTTSYREENSASRTQPINIMPSSFHLPRNVNSEYVVNNGTKHQNTSNPKHLNASNPGRDFIENSIYNSASLLPSNYRNREDSKVEKNSEGNAKGGFIEKMLKNRQPPPAVTQSSQPSETQNSQQPSERKSEVYLSKREERIYEDDRGTEANKRYINTGGKRQKLRHEYAQAVVNNRNKKPDFNRS